MSAPANLRAASPDEGIQLSRLLAARFSQNARPPATLADALGQPPAGDPNLLAAVMFQTVAAANDYWR